MKKFVRSAISRQMAPASRLSISRPGFYGQPGLAAQPGIRLYYKNMSIGLGVKVPGWTDLNEECCQQGAEGTENYRVMFTFSALF